MKSVRATVLKNRLGEVLRQAATAPVAIERHGRVVAYLVPPRIVEGSPVKVPARPGKRPHSRWTRATEERLAALCAGHDLRPSRWRRAGAAADMAGLATMLAAVRGFDRPRLLALAEALHPGMASHQEFKRWLARAPVDPARFVPMVRARMERRVYKVVASTKDVRHLRGIVAKPARPVTIEEMNRAVRRRGGR
jgi:hypothetical protein